MIRSLRGKISFTYSQTLNR